MHMMQPRGGGTQLFSGRVCSPDFRSVACELTFASEKGGLRAENFQIWGLWAENFQLWGELKFGWKLRLLRLKFSNFLKSGSCELTLLLEMGPLRATGEPRKGGLQGRTSPYPLSRSVPPRIQPLQNSSWFKNHKGFHLEDKLEPLWHRAIFS